MNDVDKGVVMAGIHGGCIVADGRAETGKMTFGTPLQIVVDVT